MRIIFSFLIATAALLVISCSAETSNNKWDNYVQKVNEEAAKEQQESESKSAASERVAFNCKIPPRSNPKPTSVHKLQPGDIDVIAAIGDSLTAANGAKASLITSVLTNYRGVSWCIGGDESVNTVGTLPNIFKKFNPNIYGWSTGTGDANSAGANLNLAVAGATSHDMYNQAVNLVNRMKQGGKVNMDNDWKLVTFFIGGNDLCNSCEDEAKYSAPNYINNIRNTLYYLKNNLKRTFVNLVLSLDVTGIDYLGGTTCRNMQKSLCDCGLSASYRPKLKQLTQRIQDETWDMVEREDFHDRDDFEVVVQPFMTKMIPPLNGDGTTGDKSYFAPDCFHFSTKGHSAAGVEMWNNMLELVGQKSDKWNVLGNAIKCPTDTMPYLATYQNSRGVGGKSLRDKLANVSN